MDDGYNWICSSKRAPNIKKRGFSRKKVEIGIKLDEDKIIKKNAEDILKTIDNTDIPSPLRKILSNNRHYYPVFFKKMENKPPKLGGELDQSIPIKSINKKLREKGINRLYDFQEKAFAEILNGESVIITAPTGMGKTEAFLIPIVHIILRTTPNPLRRQRPVALFIYPTKALGADQYNKIREFINNMGLTVAIYDGDTSTEDRQKLFTNPPDILISNADMLHYHLMGNYPFKIMIQNLRFVVIDEIHLCIGAFGTNILWILRRLRRFAPGIQLIGASATISNAKEFGETLFERPIKLISAGMTRKSDMYLSMLYPKETSTISIISSITQEFIKNNHKTLVFGNGHRAAEVINILLNKRNIKSDVHRAGLSRKHRKRVESDFREGKLDVIVSTPTLELGIDIGNLDSVVSMLTTLTSFVQRIGRAGRKGQESFATLVLRGDDPISAYYARYPEDYLGDLDPAYVEPDNDLIASFQILAMLIDKPLELDEITKYEKYLQPFIDDNKVVILDNKAVIRDLQWARSKLRNYSIRGIGHSVNIIHNKRVIGSRVLPVALSELHPGAIYLHGGNSYHVNTYNSKTFSANISRIAATNIKTQALRTISPEIIEIKEELNIEGFAAAYCKLRLTETVTGYIKQEIYSNKILGRFPITPNISYTYDTMGFVLALPVPEKLVDGLDPMRRKIKLGGTFHAIEHVLIESGNSFTGSGANQIGGIAMGDTGTIFIYDGNEHGSGLSHLLFKSLNKALGRSLKIMQDCPCGREDGCPRCTYSYQCGNNNQPLNRIGGIEALKQFGKISTDLKLDFDGVESFVAYPD